MKMIVSDALSAQPNIRHGFFTRQGGVSSGIYASLNCGFGSADAQDEVAENRKRVAGKLGIDPLRLMTVRQVHSAVAVVAAAHWATDAAPEADAIVTAEKNLGIGALSADCAPVLFCDPERPVIGAAHAGWRGAKSGVLDAAIERMEELGAKRERIFATVGPAISRDAYEVGEEFREAFLGEDDANARFFVDGPDGGKPHFDLPGYCLSRLRRAGIASSAWTGHCTYGNESLFFSYRRSTHRNEADYGRQISAIVIL